MPIKYVTGDATSPLGAGHKICAHICNDQGGWGAGFVLAISKKWKDPEENYRAWYRSDKDFELGNIKVVNTKDSHIHVANMIAQKGFGGIAVQYDKLRECLAKLCEEAKKMDASIHMPKIGTGLAGGSWNKIEPIIEEELCNKGVSVTVYTLP